MNLFGKKKQEEVPEVQKPTQKEPSKLTRKGEVRKIVKVKQPEEYEEDYEDVPEQEEAEIDVDEEETNELSTGDFNQDLYKLINSSKEDPRLICFYLDQAKTEILSYIAKQEE